MINFSEQDIFYDLDENSYSEKIKSFTAKDAVFAFIYYLYIFIVLTLLSILYLKKQIFIGSIIQILNFVICILIVKFRKQSLASIGISNKNMLKTVLSSIGFGFIFTLLLLGIYGRETLFKNIYEINSITLYRFFYCFVLVAFTEETIFRGYIQSRVFGLIKNTTLAVLLVGLMFAVIHIPMRIVDYNQNFSEIIKTYEFWVQSFKHLLSNIFYYYLYRKYNSCVPAVILHGLGNFYFSR